MNQLTSKVRCNSALCVSVLQVARDASGAALTDLRGFGARVSLFNAKKTYGTMLETAPLSLSLSALTGGGWIIALLQSYK